MPSGGWNKGLTKETNEGMRKLSETRKSRTYTSNRIGTHCSEETKRKISEANKGRTSSYKPTPEHIEKIRLQSSKPKSLESIEKRSKTIIDNGILKGENNPNYKGGEIEVECSFCKSVIKRTKLYVESHDNIFCSRTCTTNFRHGTNLTKDNPKTTYTCDNCGKEYYTSPSRIKRSVHKYCCKVCFNEHKKLTTLGEKNPSWREGVSKLPYAPIWNENLRNLIRDLYGNRCQLCGKSKEDNGKNLDVHHIDYNKENCFHYNLIPLCKNCHSLTTGNRKYYTIYFSKRVIWLT